MCTLPRGYTLLKVILSAGDDNPNVLVDEETGKVIPIPPKHGTPIKHSRPKRVYLLALLVLSFAVALLLPCVIEQA